MKRFLFVVICIAMGIGMQADNTPFSSNMENDTQYDGIERESFDFIVVGAGAGGCVVASRLSEVPQFNVLLLEAGGEETYEMDIPYLSGSKPTIDWNYTLAPQPHGGCPLGPDGVCPFPRGYVMGGSTSVNFMVFVRGNALDYDEWADLGNDGWNYESVLPYFKKMENVQIPELRDSPYRGTSGNVMVSDVHRSVLANYSLDAARLQNVPYIEDYNGVNQSGISLVQTTIFRGSRWSANSAYIRSVHRKNLIVRKHSLVSKVLIENGRAVGVEYLKDQRTYRVFANKEVILSAGAINSPKVLMLSGIGPREHLEDLDIPVVVDLPVGRTLYDHLQFLGLILKLNTSIELTRAEILSNPHYFEEYVTNHTGPLTGYPTVAVIWFLKEGEEAVKKSWPNVEVLVTTQPIRLESSIYSGVTDEFYEKFTLPITNESVIQIPIVNNKPRSKGTLTLRDNNVYSQPIIDPRYLSDDEDINVVVMAILESIRLFTSGPFARLGAQLYDTPVPQCADFGLGTYEYWTCAVRWTSATTFHPCGTCKMGPRRDPFAVVSPNLEVWGVRGLRVIDASVMPTITNGHIQAPVYMIGEKGAQLILCKHLGRHHCV